MKILSTTSNAAILQLDGRAFPGILIQGDSLRNLYRLVEDCKSNLNKDPEESHGILAELSEILQSYLAVYEKVLEENQIELPYL